MSLCEAASAARPFAGSPGDGPELAPVGAGVYCSENRRAKLLGFALLLGNRLIVVGRIKLGAIRTPGALLNGAIDLAQTAGRHAQSDYLADTHHYIPRDDLDPLRRKFLVVILALELLVDLIDGLALIMLEKDR